MIKILPLLSIYLLNSVFADSLDSNTTKELDVESDQDTQIIVVKDESGLSDDALRKRAKVVDDKKKAKVSIVDVAETIDKEGNVDLSKIQASWEELSPNVHKYDWVQTKSGEWFKGEIKGLYDDVLEFDSDEIGMYDFDFKDVVQIKSYHVMSLNIEDIASFPGILRLKDNTVKIIQGENTYEFHRNDIVSFAPNGDKERNFWSGKLTFSFDLRTGNTEQYDYNAKGKIQRRTAETRLIIDYLGRTSSKNKVETANDHRVNEKYDRYLSKDIFWTPTFAEYYTDKYKNIDMQLTAGLGLGYRFFHNKETEWSVSGGPAVVYTQYYNVQNNDALKNSSLAAQMSTKLESELTKIVDFTFDYKFTITNKQSGGYKHHMLFTFENDLYDWLDLDVTGVWDYWAIPEAESSGLVPLKNDYQLLIGLGIEF